MNDRITIELENHVAHVRMVRGDKMNAVDGAMFEAMIDAGHQLRAASDLRAVVLSGEGKAFSAGIDLAALNSGGTGGASMDILSEAYEGMNLIQYCVMQWRMLPVPVIAAIQDIAFGAGMQLALGADMRFVAPKARLSLMEAKWGLVPDMGATYLLRDLVRKDLAVDLVTSGRVVTGEEAVRIGLATRGCEAPLEEALTYARTIAQTSPDAIRAGKRLLSMEIDGVCDRILRAERFEQARLLAGTNHVEALRAGMAKDIPNFVSATS